MKICFYSFYIYRNLKCSFFTQFVLILCWSDIVCIKKNKRMKFYLGKKKSNEAKWQIPFRKFGFGEGGKKGGEVKPSKCFQTCKENDEIWRKNLDTENINTR